MPRVLSPTFRRNIEEPRNDELLVVLLEITHEQIAQPIRVANDVVDYKYEDNTYVGFPFELEVLSDTEQTPRAQLRIQNVDQRISEAIVDLTTPPRVDFMVFAGSDFGEADDDVRTANDDAEPEYVARNLRLGNITVDALNLSAEVLSFDMRNEPWPAIRTTADRVPSLDP